MYSSWPKRHLTQSRLPPHSSPTTTQLVTWLFCISTLEDIVTLPCEDSNDSMLLGWELCKKISISFSFIFHICAWKKIEHFKQLMKEILCRWINCAGLIHARLNQSIPTSCMETATLCEPLPMDVGVARSCEASSWRPSIELVPQSFQRGKSQSWSTSLHFALAKASSLLTAGDVEDSRLQRTATQDFYQIYV